MVRALRGHGLAARTSGFRYLRELLREPSVREPGATYWVMPSRESMLRNLEWLEAEGHGVTEDDCYVAPLYPRRGPVEDPDLLAILERRRPKHVFVCVGSGVQEKLGLCLKRLLPYRPGIHCVGAAIAFLSGDQARIPLWADRLALGWLVRCIRDPKVFVPRYLRAFRLAYLILRYDENPPAARRGLEVKAVVFGGPATSDGTSRTSRRASTTSCSSITVGRRRRTSATRTSASRSRPPSRATRRRTGFLTRTSRARRGFGHVRGTLKESRTCSGRKTRHHRRRDRPRRTGCSDRARGR